MRTNRECVSEEERKGNPMGKKHAAAENPADRFLSALTASIYEDYTLYQEKKREGGINRKSNEIGRNISLITGGWE